MPIRAPEYPGLSARTLRARAEALESAAGHLELDWSDDSDEIAEGLKLSRSWHSEAAELRERANDIETIAGLYLPKKSGVMSKGKKWPARDLIVKIQVPIGEDDRGQALISDEAGSIYCETEMSNALRQKMKFDLKVYFYATIAAGKLAIGRRAPWQDW